MIKRSHNIMASFDPETLLLKAKGWIFSVHINLPLKGKLATCHGTFNSTNSSFSYGYILAMFLLPHSPVLNTTDVILVLLDRHIMSST